MEKLIFEENVFNIGLLLIYSIGTFQAHGRSECPVLVFLICDFVYAEYQNIKTHSLINYTKEF